MNRANFLRKIGKTTLVVVAGPSLLNGIGCGLLSKTHKGNALFSTNTLLPPHFFFPENNVWNTKIPADAKVDPLSDVIMASQSGGDLNGFVRVECAMPYNVIDTVQDNIPFITIQQKQAGEDDPNTHSFPYMSNMVFQNGPWADDGADHHLLVVDLGAKYLYEIYQLRQQTDGSWLHEGAARFDMKTNKPRASSYQDSADAAGLPIIPGLVRMDEINGGVIPHALRMTLHTSFPGYLFPATHGTYSTPHTDPPAFAPMGARFRLKAAIDENNYDRTRKPIIQCLKQYGAFFADNGTNFAVTACNDDAAFRAALGDQFYGPDPGKGDDASFRLLNKNGQDLTIDDFELMDMGKITPLPPLH